VDTFAELTLNSVPLKVKPVPAVYVVLVFGLAGNLTVISVPPILAILTAVFQAKVFPVFVNV